MHVTQENSPNIQSVLHHVLAAIQPHLGASWWPVIVAGGVGIVATPSMRQLLRESIRAARQVTLYWLLGRRKDLSTEQYTEIAKMIFKRK
jgi:NAD(P)H-flavin reductase